MVDPASRPRRRGSSTDDGLNVEAIADTADGLDAGCPFHLLEFPSQAPDVLIKGGDYGKEGVVGWEFVESYGGRVVVAPLVKGKSSTNTIEKMKTLQAKT